MIFKLFKYLVQNYRPRKLGAFDDPDERDFIADNVVEKTERKYLAGVIMPPDLLNIYPSDQKNTNRCTAYAIMHIIEIMVTRRLGMKCDLDQDQQWKWQLETGASEKRGDTLQNALKTAVKHKHRLVAYDKNDPSGVRIDYDVSFEGYARIEKTMESIMKWGSEGHPIFTGVNVYGGYVDDEGYWKMSGADRLGGHAVDVIPHKSPTDLLNSWGEYWRGDGTCKIHPETIHRCLSMYILFGMKIERAVA